MGNLSYVGSENTDGPLTVIRLISGDGTAVHWTKQKWEWQGEWYEPIAAGTPALGDVDLDGEPEIVVALAPFIDLGIRSSNWINPWGIAEVSNVWLLYSTKWRIGADEYHRQDSLLRILLRLRM